MNWQKISVNNPKAWDKVTKKYASHIQLLFNGCGNNRFLYDFFDGYEIFVNVANFRDEETPNRWAFRLQGITEEETIYRSRPEAETEAFEKAFEILEKQLGVKK
jgi:hypothetical protein